MKNPLQSRGAANLGLLIARLPLGVMFFYAGQMKIFTMGVRAFVNMSSGSIPSFLPLPIGKAYLYALPYVELLIGTLIIIGLFARTAGLIATLVLISIMIAVTGVKDPQGGPFNLNVVLLALALLVLLTGPGAIALDNVQIKLGGKIKHAD